jgi:hypothetical protein
VVESSAATASVEPPIHLPTRAVPADVAAAE